MLNQKSYDNDSSYGTLYLVPTPIGNLADMSPRALEILEKVDLIAAEDTRNTQKLLNYFDIQTKQKSFHEHNTNEKVDELITDLLNGKDIAQVSDAGMPSISDPGAELVSGCISQNIKVVPLPGPNAALTALIASGLTPQPFYFHGFLPRKKKDLFRTLEDLMRIPSTLIFYESPHRLKKTIEAIAEIYPANTQIVLAREISKRFEEFIRGSIIELLNWIKTKPIRGEYVIMIEKKGVTKEEDGLDELLELPLKDHVQRLMDEEEFSSKIAIKVVAKQRGLPKREVYAAYHNL